MSIQKAKFSIGNVVKHRHFEFRGVIYDVDFEFNNSEEWYQSIPLSDEGWRILNSRWMYFFFGLAILNELIWRTQSEEFCVNFKVWGMLPITFIFTAFQIGLINKYKINE